jgi:hypothetical protein
MNETLINKGIDAVASQEWPHTLVKKSFEIIATL